ncbi:hypothetical protein LOK49_LG04G03432 [Camellia lanceoleosa]|uniref:Uncharacterized protein n=1 Tax=Camellia lanceoleosa TaxID=1840588 RepID=A0ACC0I682_9ERIC|nr:hypothetical protein LOK49_LG04G03432 [Camellia lanceoleosa]
MASHHHHCHHPPRVAAACCCCHYSTCCTPPAPDPFLNHPPPPPQSHCHSPYLNPPHETFLHHPPPPTHQRKYQEEFQLHQQTQTRTQPVVSSLLRRIAALESSLRRQYSASSNSLRDAAARTIQTHFRAFLVRRSRTLRQLKDLASVKSTLNSFKSSFVDNAHLHSQAFSRRAMNLLHKLDSIQGGDPMIRDGKRSIRIDIIRFIEFIDGVSKKRSEISSIDLKNARFGRTGNKSRVLYGGQKISIADFREMAGDERVLVEKLRGRVEKIHGFSRVSEDDYDEEEEGIELENPRIFINGNVCASHNREGGLVKRQGGVQPKVKKNVSFADNGNVSRVFLSTHEPISTGDTNSSDGSVSIDEERELVDNLCREVEEIRGLSNGSQDDDEAHTEDGSERNPRRNLGAEENYEISGHHEGENGNFVFSAPLPVKMESKADLMKKRKAVKIVV